MESLDLQVLADALAVRGDGMVSGSVSALWPVKDRGCIVDIDTLHDLHEAERLLAINGC